MEKIEWKILTPTRSWSGLCRRNGRSWMLKRNTQLYWQYTLPLQECNKKKMILRLLASGLANINQCSWSYLISCIFFFYFHAIIFTSWTYHPIQNKRLISEKLLYVSRDIYKCITKTTKSWYRLPVAGNRLNLASATIDNKRRIDNIQKQVLEAGESNALKRAGW